MNLALAFSCLRKLIPMLLACSSWCVAQTVQQGNVSELWDQKPSPRYILARPSSEWTSAMDVDIPDAAPQIEDQQPIVTITATDAVEARLTENANRSASPIKEIAVTSARDQYARVFFSVQAITGAASIQVSEVFWNARRPAAGRAHQRAVRFGPVAVNRNGSEKKYRMAPLWLEVVDELTVSVGQQATWMLQWWIPKDHPSGNWTGTITVRYRKPSSQKWHSKLLPVVLQVLPVQLEHLPSDRARYGVWYGPTWMWTTDESYKKHFLEMREAGINQLGMMNISPYGFKYEAGMFSLKPGKVKEVGFEFRNAVSEGHLLVDMRLLTGYASLFGDALTDAGGESDARLDSLKLSPDPRKNLYTIAPVKSDWTKKAYLQFAGQIARAINELPGKGSAYYFPQEEPSSLEVRRDIMQYFAPLTAQAGLPVVLVSNAGSSKKEDMSGVNSSISLICTNWFDQESVAQWVKEARPVEFFNMEGNLRLTAGFFLHYFPVPIRGLTIWAYQFGNPLKDADTGRDGVYAPVHFLTYPGDKGPVPTLRWVQYAEGITDRRYVYTAERMIERLGGSGIDVAQFKRRLDELRNEFSSLYAGNLKDYSVKAALITGADIDWHRRSHLELLRDMATLEATLQRATTKNVH